MKYTVVAATLHRTRINMYTSTGETLELSTADLQAPKVIADLLPLSKGAESVEIEYEDTNFSVFSNFEASTGTNLFVIPFETLNRVFNSASKETYSALSSINNLVELLKESNAKIVSLENTINVAKQRAISEADGSHNTQGTDTIVAVTKEGLVANVELLESQMIHAVKTGNTKGLTLFLERVAKVNRQHSAQQLLTFLEQADLPIAEDGSFIAYKLLNRRLSLVSQPRLGFADCYTGRVFQAVGSEVSMDESLVDPDNSVDCSNGLHIARRQYIKGFTGTDLFLVKVNPEDVIAVPQYDANKVRVCKYTILSKLPASGKDLIKANKPLDDCPESMKLLASALSGEYSITHKVVIGGHQGTKITFSEEASSVKGESLVEAATLSDVDSYNTLAEPVDPTKIIKDVIKVTKEAKPTKTHKESIEMLLKTGMTKTTYEAIEAIRKKSRKSYVSMGLSDESLRKISKLKVKFS